jgi:hypothetical protein
MTAEMSVQITLALANLLACVLGVNTLNVDTHNEIG